MPKKRYTADEKMAIGQRYIAKQESNKSGGKRGYEAN